MSRSTLKLDTSGLQKMLMELDGLGGNVNKAVEDALLPAARKVQADTKTALAKQNLPARGKYWTGTTDMSVITDSAVQWEGQTAWVPVGFDFSEAGAGGYLISGTPRMRPNQELNRIYKKKKYMAEIQEQMSDVIMSYLVKQWGKLL